MKSQASPKASWRGPIAFAVAVVVGVLVLMSGPYTWFPHREPWPMSDAQCFARTVARPRAYMYKFTTFAPDDGCTRLEPEAKSSRLWCCPMWR